MASQIINKFKQLDAYAKTLEDFRVKTASGAISKYWFILIKMLFYDIYTNILCLHFQSLLPVLLS